MNHNIHKDFFKLRIALYPLPKVCPLGLSAIPESPSYRNAFKEEHQIL